MMEIQLEKSRLSSQRMVKVLAMFAMLIFSLPGHSSEYGHKGKQADVWFAQTRHFDVAEVPYPFQF